MYKVLFVFGDDRTYEFKEAEKMLQEQYPDQFKFDFFDTFEIDADPEKLKLCYELALESDFIIVGVHGGLSFFNSFNSFFESFQGKKKFFIDSGIEDEVLELMSKLGLAPQEYGKIYQYYKMGGKENALNMTLWMASQFAGLNYIYEEPINPRWEGLYDPQKEIDNEDLYITELVNENKPVIGVLFNFHNKQKNNMLHINRVIEKIRELGAVPLPVYSNIIKDDNLGSKGLNWVIDNYLMKDGKPIIDALIVTTGYSLSVMANPGDGSQTIEESIFEKLQVPVFQAMSTYYTLEQWEKSIAGLDSMVLSINVYHPEFDGQIITVPIAYSDIIEDAVGEKRIFRPIEDRIDRVCSLAINWAKLRFIASEDKKVAIIFHNMPPRNDMIGCAFGLDTPETVFNIVEALKNNGVKTNYDFENGADIINRIIEGVTNDTRWLPAETMVEKSVDVVQGDLYRQWFSQFGEPVREKMIQDWGDPPGEFMVSGDNVAVPGIMNGNIFIGLQPPRAFEEQAEECYHSTDLVCPHQYIAYYKWIEHVFKANVIMHIGTHGTLEWLPGKEIGLSKNCYPELAIGNLPHLYPYIINVPGEGIQAKRRSAAVILEHLIPSMVESDTYDELTEMDDLVKEYYHAKQADKGKVSVLEQKIWDLAVKMNLDKDISLTKEKMDDNPGNTVEEIHVWVSKIKSSLIKDGLHIYGEVPPEDRFKNMLRTLVRLRNGEIPSLMEGICTAKEYDLEELQQDSGRIWPDGRTSLMILDEVTLLGKALFDELEKNGFDEKEISQVIDKAFGNTSGDTKPLVKCLSFVCNDLKQRLEATTDEIKYLIKGVNGEFVSPGPSGCPSRGNARILPTGRNFYSIDPSAVPTRSSWEVGKKLGDQLLQRYLQDEGKYPESIAIVIYAGETMKTCGDDIAEIYYLLGIKPKWLGNTDRVIGLEVIPLEELKRPRIDVTMRISGMFRDAFPNLIERMEEAVNLVAGLDEDYEQNFVRKHISEEVEELVAQGVDKNNAMEQSSLRIFGCPPGTYGAGVDILINSKQWENVKDLGNIYTLWGGHAYGKKIHGDKKQEVFSRRLAKADVTVKNESSMEIDMLDSDDYYNYHGGLIAAVRTYSGKKPRSYSGNTANPDNTELLDVHEETSRIMRARINNPKWVEGLKKHGYKGAQEISAMVDIVFGWDATSDVIDDWMYDKIVENYIFNEENRKWIEEVNNWAMHNMVERLLEAHQREMWNASQESLDQLRKIYMEIEGNIEERL